MKAALISSALGFALRTAETSMRLTSGVGTRNAVPSTLPFSSGSTSPMALVIPVVVGMMLIAAARALRRSLSALSRIIWLPV